MLVLIGITIIAVTRSDTSVAVIAVALAGVVASFLLFNWFPARVFMGDAGSLALGSAIVALTAELHLIWFLPVLGIVFVVEAASVVVNVTAIRRFGRRVLRASPIHHHFEELGLREQRLVLCLRGRGRGRHRADRALRARRGCGVVSEQACRGDRRRSERSCVRGHAGARRATA